MKSCQANVIMLFLKTFHKNRISQKSILKTNISFSFYHPLTSTVFHPISLTFFSDFLSFDSRVFIFSEFCISSNNRGRNRRCSVKKGVIRNFANFRENTSARSEACNFIKKETPVRCFPVNFVEFLSTPFLQNTFWWLLL